MGIAYGISSRRVTSADISVLTPTNGTIISSGDDSSGGYAVQFQFDSGGCGTSPDSFVTIELKDTPVWTNISCEFYNVGNASCWAFNEGKYAGNMIPFSTSLDRVKFCQNSFELVQFQTKMTACDNTSTNFMHPTYKVGTFNKFFVTRRRESLATPGQIVVQRSCNSYGASSYVIIRNIFVW